MTLPDFGMLAQMPTVDFTPRLMVLILGAVVAVLCRLFKSLIPEWLAVIVLLPLIEEIGTKVGVLDLVLLRMAGCPQVTAFLITTGLFVVLHLFWTVTMGVSDKLLRIVDSIYIGILCGAFYLTGFPHDPDAFYWAILICIGIHLAINLVIVVLKLLPFLFIILAVIRILLALLYLYQAWQFLGNWRAMMIPFFLHRFLL